jgi:hypothetical protein
MKPEVVLIEEDGNAFAILAKCRKAARNAGWPKEEIDAVLNEMQSGNYDHLLRTAMKYFDVQ